MNLILVLAALAAPAGASPQPSLQQAEAQASPMAKYPRHLVMITRAGPNFSNLREHRAQAQEHQALWRRLQTEGHTFAGGAFEGQPIMGMTIFNAGIDEARARDLIKNDPFPGLGITEYEFRTFMVVNGSFKPAE